MANKQFELKCSEQLTFWQILWTDSKKLCFHEPMDLRTKLLIALMGLSCLLSGCYHPPYNNFKPHNRTFNDVAVGAGAGIVAGSFVGAPWAGGGIGAAAFTINGLYKESKAAIITALRKADIQYVEYGDLKSLIIPTDRYFLFNSPRLNELCYPGLYLIVKLLKYYPKSIIYIGGFTDDVGADLHKYRLTEARAEAMLTYLWANGIPRNRLAAAGYGEHYAVSNNKIIHGSAQNRRLEIQWFYSLTPIREVIPYLGPTK